MTYVTSIQRVSFTGGKPFCRFSRTFFFPKITTSKVSTLLQRSHLLRDNGTWLPPSQMAWDPSLNPWYWSFRIFKDEGTLVGIVRFFKEYLCTLSIFLVSWVQFLFLFGTVFHLLIFLKQNIRKTFFNNGFLACWFYTCILSMWSRRAGLLHPPPAPNIITLHSLSPAAFWYLALLNPAIWLRPKKTHTFEAYWHLPKLYNLQPRNFKTALLL